MGALVPTIVPALVCVTAIGGGCDDDAARVADPADAESAEPAVSDDAGASDDGMGAVVDAPTDADVRRAANAERVPPTRAPRTADEPAEVAIEHRITERALMVYAEPRYDVPFRGKIPRREAFALYERTTGDARCEGDGWGRVGVSAYACLEHTTPTKQQPIELPVLAKGELTPFFYARRLGKGDDVPDPPRWRNRAALAAAAPPADTLAREHDYAFVRRRRTSDGVLLTDSAFRVVRESDVKRLEPSDFAGRDLLADPIPEGHTLAWSVVWRHATVRAEPQPEADEIGRVRFHDTVYVAGEPTHRGGDAFYALADGEGWLSDDEVQRFVVMAAPTGVGSDELWLDVEIGEQTLAVMRGDTPVFATLIASGSHKNPTPPGVYRLTGKMAYSDMRSRADEEEPYHVEAVPWVMYFDGRYALHGTFWHNRFGRRTSHGCINLSAHDARHVYELTAPHPPGGWVSVYEHAEDPGTVLRVRKGSTTPEDRRG